MYTEASWKGTTTTNSTQHAPTKRQRSAEHTVTQHLHEGKEEEEETENVKASDFLLNSKNANWDQQETREERGEERQVRDGFNTVMSFVVHISVALNKCNKKISLRKAVIQIWSFEMCIIISWNTTEFSIISLKSGQLLLFVGFPLLALTFMRRELLSNPSSLSTRNIFKLCRKRTYITAAPLVQYQERRKLKYNPEAEIDAQVFLL